MCAWALKYSNARCLFPPYCRRCIHHNQLANDHALSFSVVCRSFCFVCPPARSRDQLTKELHAQTPCAGLGTSSVKTISRRSNAWHHQDGRDTGIKCFLAIYTTRVKYSNSSITVKYIRHTTFAFKRAVTSTSLEAIAGVVVAGRPYL